MENTYFTKKISTAKKIYRVTRRTLKITAFFSIFIVFGFVFFIQSIPKTPKAPYMKAQAGIVLTGGSGRIGAGIFLLENNYIDRLFISGVYTGVSLKNLLRINNLKTSKAKHITLGYQAQDTSDNALETAIFIKQNSIKSAYLITGAYHMPRAKHEIEYRIPSLSLIPYPIHPASIKTDRWYMFPGTFSIYLREYLKTVAVLIKIKLHI